MTPDGSGQVNLTNTPAPVGESTPTYSPDGKTIYYVRCNDTDGCRIWSMHADGSSQAPLTTGDNTVGDFDPSVSPDNAKLAFFRCAASSCSIVIRDLKSGAETPLAGGAGNDFDPAFSPDQKKLAFTTDIPPGGPNQGELSLMNEDGSGASPLVTLAAAEENFDPSWEFVYSCGGKRATIVGSDSGEKINGTKKSDVIVGNGGKDKISGRGGNDRICGGKGKDNLNGGGGGDLCSGGKGRDTGKGCEKGKL
jgi:Tol biopolymer transport system component